jgi:hypothetical protein
MILLSCGWFEQFFQFICPKCNNFFPIIEDIPMMLKPELRNEDIEREFTNKWADKLKELFKPST